MLEVSNEFIYCWTFASSLFSLSVTRLLRLFDVFIWTSSLTCRAITGTLLKSDFFRLTAQSTWWRFLNSDRFVRSCRLTCRAITGTLLKSDRFVGSCRLTCSTIMKSFIISVPRILPQTCCTFFDSPWHRNWISIISDIQTGCNRTTTWIWRYETSDWST